MNSVRDLIDEKIRDYSWENEEDPIAIKMDTYSLALLREELGVPLDRGLSKYHGLKIIVDPDTNDDLVQVIGIAHLA